MAKSRKVIITCAVTGSIHTPSMSPHLPVTAAGDRRRRHRRGRSRRRDRPSACAQPAGRPSRPDAGGLRAVPQGDQAALQRGGEHHHRRRADHDGRGARQAGRDLQAGGRLAQHGHDELRALPDDPALQGQVQTRLGGAVSRRLAQAACSRTPSPTSNTSSRPAPSNNTRFEIECYDIGHLYTLRHFLDRGVVKPPLFVQSVFGILGGIGAHPEDVIMMKRTADRLLGDNYHWSVLGAGANQMRVAAHGGGDGRQCARRHGGFALDRRRQARRVERRSRSRRCARSSKGWASRSPSPDEAREILSLKGGDKVNF